MNPEQIKSFLGFVAEALPACQEKIVVLTMLGNLHAGVSNGPLADHAQRIAQQMLADLKSP